MCMDNFPIRKCAIFHIYVTHKHAERIQIGVCELQLIARHALEKIPGNQHKVRNFSKTIMHQRKLRRMEKQPMNFFQIISNNKGDVNLHFS